MERTDQAESAYMLPRDAARALGVSVRTLSRMGDNGDIRMIRRAGGHRRYFREDIDRAKEPAA
ncbi:helix-turn-helix domain-containing protein [Leifsonia aquatica]|uniref:helix-turn-helix domain-containing protein n=1 Tax=Leifsonia aquatica TaxID=144185 RepID=UPI00380C9639